jgi:hypothetical protein
LYYAPALSDWFRRIRRHAHLGLPFRHLREGLRKPGKHYDGGGLMLSVALRAEIADLKRVLDLQGKLAEVDARLDRIEQTRSPLRSVGVTRSTGRACLVRVRGPLACHGRWRPFVLALLLRQQPLLAWWPKSHFL